MQEIQNWPMASINLLIDFLVKGRSSKIKLISEKKPITLTPVVVSGYHATPS